jgi:hypothetical protein
MTDGGTPLSRQQVLRDPAAACPELVQFLAAYFHQDWPVDGGAWESVVDAFVTESPHGMVVAAADELSCLLALRLRDGQLDTVLERLGASVRPAAFGLTTGAWLEAVRKRLRKEER